MLYCSGERSTKTPKLRRRRWRLEFRVVSDHAVIAMMPRRGLRTSRLAVDGGGRGSGSEERCNGAEG